ncbi:MAG: helix-turn-helix domain-containing protein [Actinobacteria bacterium]|nr:helix-turn-helix domain-containing protein [Actinomycetota bacterium]
MHAESGQAEVLDGDGGVIAVEAQSEEEAQETGAGSPAFRRLGSNLLGLREAAGKTQESLAAKVGGPDSHLGSSWVSQLEAGRAQTGILQGLRLAAALDSSIDELLEGIFWNPGEIARKPREKKPDAERLAGYLTVLPPGEPAFEEAPEVVTVEDRKDVAAVIARNVRDARTRRHLRQRDLGLADTSAAGLIESGIRQPELQGLLTIARSLEVPTEFLLRGMRWEPPDLNPGIARGRGRRHDFHAHDEAVTRLWRDDLTAAEIAVEIGITQPSVEGIVRRLRARGIYLPSRVAGRRSAGAAPAEDASGFHRRPAPDAEDVGRLHDRIAANLKRHRLAAGLSLEQLAEATEMRLDNIWRAETQRSEPRLMTAVRLAAGLRVPLAAITRGITWDPATDALGLEGQAEGSEPRFGPRLGANIRRHRRRLGLSQEEVAARTGIFRRHFSAIESGAALPRPMNLLVLAHGLEADLATLLAGTCDWYVRPLPPPEYADGEGPPTKAERQERLLRMWGQGASTRSIADALDLTPSAVGGVINEMRAVGIDVPYRHPPTSAAQLSGRLRRRRRARRRPAVAAMSAPPPKAPPKSADPGGWPA